MAPTTGEIPRTIFWHRELPPLDAEFVGEHTVEATSGHVAGAIVHGDELWNRCYDGLMAEARLRLKQEMARLEGDYAHVLQESIDGRRNEALRESWLHGRFTYALYRRGKNHS